MYLKANSPHALAAGKSIIGFNLINGREVEGDLSLIQSKSAVDSRDLVGLFPDSGEKDVARAAKAAAEAFRGWSATRDTARLEVVQRTAGILAIHGERLARLITREIGMTPREALGEVQEALEACAHYTREVPVTPGPPARRRPVGVCGLLATGASPLAAPVRRLLPAILCGNTVVWKPSDNAPTVAYLLLRAMIEAGLPPGVVNTVNGRGRAGCGKHFLAGLEKGLFQSFSFIGSAILGRMVGEICGRNLVLPSLELVGKGAMVVLPDADLDRAVEDAVQAAFGQAGQRPLGLANILVQTDCAGTFQQRFLDRVASLELGNPVSHPGVAFGPLINARTAAAFREHWASGQAEGATLLTGGEPWTEANRDRRVRGDIGHGAYLQPCVWAGVRPGMGLFRNQLPGPTVNLLTVTDLDEALAWTRAPRLPLVGLYTQNSASLDRFYRDCEADVILANAVAVEPAARLPFAGQGTAPGRHLVLDGFTRWQTSDEADREDDPAVAVEAASPAPTLLTDWASL